jgi:AcrR family transcriptional regulator
MTVKYRCYPWRIVRRPSIDRPEAVARRSVGRPPRIRRETILDTAASIDPLDLSLARIARELGVTTSAIHYYFPTKADLLGALAALRGRSLEVPSRSGRTWQEWLVDAGFVLRDLLAEHADAIDRFPAGFLTLAAPLNEAVYGTFLELGLTPAAAFDAFQLFNACCLGGASSLRRHARVLELGPGDLVELLDELGFGADSPFRRMVPVIYRYEPDEGFRRDLRAVVFTIESQLPSA